MKKFFLILGLIIFNMGMIAQTVDSLGSVFKDCHWKNEQKVVFPNPFSDKLVIKYDRTIYGEIETSATIRYLFTNELVYEGVFKNEVTLQTSDWKKGFYVVFIQHIDPKRGTEKIKIYKE